MTIALIVLGGVCLMLIAAVIFLIAVLHLAYEDIRQTSTPIPIPEIDWDSHRNKVMGKEP